MPCTENVPRRSEESAVAEPQRASGALAAAPAPAPHPNAPPKTAFFGASGPSGVTIKLEEEDGPRRYGAASGPARVPASGPPAARAAAPAPVPAHNHDAAAGAGGSSRVTLVKEEEAEETLGQQRDRLALALAHGPVRVDCQIKVEDTDEEDTSGGQDAEVEVGPGGAGRDREDEEGLDGEERLGGEGGLALLAAAAAPAAHVPGDDGGRGGAPRRSTPADRTARAKRGRTEIAADNDVPVAPAPKRRRAGAQVGKSGLHGVYELDDEHIKKDTPWLKWRVQLSLPGHTSLLFGFFPTVDDAARAYDAEVRRRGWAHVRALNFPQPEEQAAYAQAGERCDERGLPLSLAPEPPVGAQGATATQGAAGQPPPKLSVQKPGKSGLFGVSKQRDKCSKATPWQAFMIVPGAAKQYRVGQFDTKEEAARAYDAEVWRRGWTHLKRLNFPDLADDATLPPSFAAGAEAPGPV